MSTNQLIMIRSSMDSSILVYLKHLLGKQGSFIRPTPMQLPTLRSVAWPLIQD